MISDPSMLSMSCDWQIKDCMHASVHSMQDYIPEEELAKFLTKQGDKAGESRAAELEAKQKIGADNIGHKLRELVSHYCTLVRCESTHGGHV